LSQKLIKAQFRNDKKYSWKTNTRLSIDHFSGGVCMTTFPVIEIFLVAQEREM
jgi:hypothetical protein